MKQEEYEVEENGFEYVQGEGLIEYLEDGDYTDNRGAEDIDPDAVGAVFTSIEVLNNGFFDKVDTGSYVDLVLESVELTGGEGDHMVELAGGSGGDYVLGYTVEDGHANLTVDVDVSDADVLDGLEGVSARAAANCILEEYSEKVSFGETGLEGYEDDRVPSLDFGEGSEDTDHFPEEGQEVKIVDRDDRSEGDRAEESSSTNVEAFEPDIDRDPLG